MSSEEGIEQPQPPPHPVQEDRRKSVVAYKDFRELIENKDRSLKVALFTHSCPDPDGISSMMGAEWLLRKMGVEACMFYAGEVSHPQNGCMAKGSRLKFTTAPILAAVVSDEAVAPRKTP